MSKVSSITKMLSANDLGETGGHQSGIHVPKKEEILSFFPRLDNSAKNPRYMLTFLDQSDQRWELCFIYYNNKYFGGTRNEFRLTRMTAFFRENNLKVGDELFLTNEADGTRRITYRKNTRQAGNRLKLDSEWKIINF